MLELNALYNILDKYAPFYISRALIEKGDYDNSGIIVRHHEQIKKILFSLDLSEAAIKNAQKLKCDTIITHHPAIYYPIKSIDSTNAVTKPIIMAAGKGLNVISLHLNLDVCSGGIDENLAEALGAKDYKIIDMGGENYGYGREFKVIGKTLSQFAQELKRKLGTKKVITYGSPKTILKKVASFCGGGSGYAEKYLLNGKISADAIVTSDIPHHIVKELVEAGKNVIIPTHYAAENYGFRKFYEAIVLQLKNDAQGCFFTDKRFV